MECPTKLYYEGNKEYANQNIEDSFLLALAEGGFQVGELAKYYYAGGHMIGSLNYAEALAETNKLLQKDRVIIYEAAVQCDNFFVRTDILIKDNDRIRLIEVKAKSVDFASEEDFLNKMYAEMLSGKEGTEKYNIEKQSFSKYGNAYKLAHDIVEEEVIHHAAV